MASYKPMFVLVISIVGMHACSSVKVHVIDFSEPGGRITQEGISLFSYPIKRDTEISIICPKLVNGRTYSFYPFDPLSYAVKISYGDEYSYDYVPREYYKLKIARRHEILGSLHGDFIKFEDLNDVQKLSIRYPPNEFLIRRGFMYLLYLCVDKEDASNESYLEVLGMNLTESLISSTLLSTYDKDSVPRLSSGVGIAIICLADLPYATHGCSTLPSQLFLNEQNIEPAGKTFCAELDVMLTPNIGFYCDGNLDAGILITRLGENSQSFLVYTEYPVFDNELTAKIGFISFIRTGLLYPFEEKFYCRDRETGAVKGSITIRRTRDLVCDINAMLMKNRIRPIDGNWYDVVVHPGDVLTIKFPAENGYYVPKTKEYKHCLGHENEAFVSTIFPRFIRRSANVGLDSAGSSAPWPSQGELCRFIYVDESQRHRGQIVFKFSEDASNDEMVFYFIYHCEWRLHRRNTDIYDIVAPIKLQFVANKHRT